MILISLSMISINSWSEPEKNNDRVEIKKGEKAPFDGILISKDALALILVQNNKDIKSLKIQIEDLEQKSKFEKELCEARCEIKLDSEQRKTGNCEVARAKENQICEKALDRANKTPWYKSPTLMTFLGLGIGAGICTAAR